MEQLAGELAQNYLDTSLSSHDIKNNRKAKMEQVFNPEFVPGNPGKPSRNILILGAGASVAAFGSDAFPAATKAMDVLDEKLAAKLGDRPSWITERINNEKERLRVSYKYEEAFKDFETHLAILSAIYSPQEIAIALTGIFGERYWPHLTFELIAHMLKHRFIDVVINFNFDELLDQAIQEELGRSEYHHIISDGDCRSIDSVMIGNRLKVPIYIKPHGTARHTSTLRFTKEHYFTLPDAMRRFMQTIIAGHTREDGKGDPYPTNIISVGFGMRSVDLTQMLHLAVEKNPGRRMALYHLNVRAFEPTIGRLKEETKIEDQFFIDVENEGFGGLHSTLRKLVDRVSDHFRAPFKPRGVARHELINALFFDPSGSRIPRGGNNGKNDADYYRARLCAELVISLAKGNGRTDVSALVDDRVGIYFDRLRDETAGTKGTRRTRESLAKVLELFERGNHRLWLGGIDQNVVSAGYPPEWNTTQHGDWLWSALKAALDRVGNDEISARIKHFRDNPVESARVGDLLKTLVESSARDINANFQHRHLLLASEPDADEVLHTNLSLTLKLSQLMESDWELMLAVSEYGRVVTECLQLMDGNSPHRRKFCVVLAKTDQVVGDPRKERLKQRLPAGDVLELLELPFWLHNHHMVIVLKREPDLGEWKIKGGIRYDRQGLSNRINPVYVGDRNTPDLERLRDTFFRYVWEIRHPNWSARPWSEEAARKEIENIRHELLADWWTERETA